MLKHAFISAKADGADATKLRPSNWNDDHVFAGGDTGSVLVRDTSVPTYGAAWQTKPAIDVRDYGAVGGAADDTAAIQAALNAGGREVFIPGTYNYSSQITITSRVRLFGPGTLNETTLLEKGIYINNVDDVRIEGLTFTGVETRAAWDAGSAGFRQAFKAFIWFEDCANGVVRDVRSSGKRGVVHLDTCEQMHVDNVRHTGFLGATSSAAADANWYSCINIQGGRQNHVANCDGVECGSVVLLAMDSSYNTVDGITGHDSHDSFVYNSSGDHSTFRGCSVEDSVGAGLKIRGTGHTVSGNCCVSNTGAGISLTGNGLTPDAFGANGSGTVCAGNVIRACASYAIQVGSQDGYLPRNFVVSNNTIEGSLGASGFAPINIEGVKGMVVAENIVRSSLADYAVYVGGSSGAELTGCQISGNIITDTSGEGMRLQYVDDSVISHNVFDDITSSQALEARNCDGNICTGNVAGNGKALRFNSSYSCSNNIVTNNEAPIGGPISASLNTLSVALDYEEGTWAPAYATTGTAFSSVTYSVQSGTWKRIKNQIRITGIVRTSAITVGSASGEVTVSGLPYANGTGNSFNASVTLANVTGFGGDHPIVGTIASGASVIQLLYRATVNGADLSLVPSDMATGASANQIVFSATYAIA